MRKETEMEETKPTTFVVLYDLKDPRALKKARRHRGFWGRLYTKFCPVGDHRFALIFRPSTDERWRPWERVRRRWILEDVAHKQKEGSEPEISNKEHRDA